MREREHLTSTQVVSKLESDAELSPGKPELCEGNGKHPFFECCCDECDYFLLCFPQSLDNN